MQIKKFTEEEQEILLSSPYVAGVTSQFVYFTAEFKKEFHRMYKAGMKPKKIVKELGIDPIIIGQSRINGLKRHIMEDLKEGKGFTENGSETAVANYGKRLSPEAKIRRLEHELAYTKQELEFVKKIIAAGREDRK